MHGNTPLHNLVMSLANVNVDTASAVVAMLFERGTDPSTPDNQGNTLLHNLALFLQNVNVNTVLAVIDPKLERLPIMMQGQSQSFWGRVPQQVGDTIVHQIQVP